MRSVMQRTPRDRTLSAVFRALSKVVPASAIRSRFWLGMTMTVSAVLSRLAKPYSAARMRRAPSKLNGRVTTPTVKIFFARHASAMTGAAPVPVPPPIPAVMKHMS
ncbi:hypothetical protein D3C71_1510470 [compost metagenome]